MGYIPYIDMIHFKTQYRAKRKVNPWNLFFSQPPEFEQNLLKFQTSKVYSRYSPPEKEDENLFVQYDFCNYSAKKKVFDSLFVVSHDIMKEVDKLAEELDISNCIGVYARGTDYTAMKPKHHHIQPSSSQLIQKCNEFIAKYDAKVFLVTEDRNIYEDFVGTYSDNLVVIDEDIHFDSYTKNVPLYRRIKSQDSILVGQTYLKKILLLSKCKYLIGGKTSGSLWACIFNDELYNDVYLFDFGRYS